MILAMQKKLRYLLLLKSLLKMREKKILDQLLPMMTEMGYGYKNNTIGIKRIYKEGIEFKDGSSLEAELKIIFPNWEPHHFMKKLPFVDDQGFVVTDLYM